MLPAQTRFAAIHRHRIVNLATLHSLAGIVYSPRHAARVRAELAVADRDRLLAIAFNALSWAWSKPFAIDADELFIDEPAPAHAMPVEPVAAIDAPAAASVALTTALDVLAVTLEAGAAVIAAPAGATERQMGRLAANARALGLSPADFFDLAVKLDGRRSLRSARDWRDTSAGFVGVSIARSDALLAALRIPRPANPLDVADEPNALTAA